MWKLWVQHWNLRSVAKYPYEFQLLTTHYKVILNAGPVNTHWIVFFFSALHFVCLPSLTGMAGFFCLRPRRMKKRTSGMKISNASTHWWQRGTRELDWLTVEVLATTPAGLTLCALWDLSIVSPASGQEMKGRHFCQGLFRHHKLGHFQTSGPLTMTTYSHRDTQRYRSCRHKMHEW